MRIGCGCFLLNRACGGWLQSERETSDALTAGLMALLAPVLQSVDEHVKSTQASQLTLTSQLDALQEGKPLPTAGAEAPSGSASRAVCTAQRCTRSNTSRRASQTCTRTSRGSLTHASSSSRSTRSSAPSRYGLLSQCPPPRRAPCAAVPTRANRRAESRGEDEPHGQQKLGASGQEARSCRGPVGHLNGGQQRQQRATGCGVCSGTRCTARTGSSSTAGTERNPNCRGHRRGRCRQLAHRETVNYFTL